MVRDLVVSVVCHAAANLVGDLGGNLGGGPVDLGGNLLGDLLGNLLGDLFGNLLGDLFVNKSSVLSDFSGNFPGTSPVT